MKALTEVMKEAEGWLDCFLQGEIGKRAWRRTVGGGQPAVVAGKHLAWCSWSVDGDTLLPRMEVWHDGDKYSVSLERTLGGSCALYRWRCPDAYGISGDIDFSCACRGGIIFP